MFIKFFCFAIVFVYPCTNSSFTVKYVTVLEIVRQAVPSKAAWKIFLTGKVFDANEAQTFGVVDEIVPADQLLARAVQVCNDLFVLLDVCLNVDGLGFVSAQLFCVFGVLFTSK